jgi:hypothetical protein
MENPMSAEATLPLPVDASEKRIPSVPELAQEFAAALLVTIGEDALRQVIARNDAHADSACASHDFCDANEVMFRAVNQFGPWKVDEVIQDPAWCTLWGDAWALAKAEKFAWMLEPEPQPADDSPSP